ncbi:putative glutathionylspermidine-utilizing glutathione transferase [Acinetobacter baumannii 1437282]|nr:putative glutathionylspermidine-utilizing glutathione transferase [Acinetobacter baumannii 1437282]
MKDSDYIPPQVWQWNGDKTDLNQPTSGSRYEHKLPVGKHPLQLYSLATPNGQKVTILLEELLALGHVGAEYDAWLIKIGEGQQFGSGFVEINPNSKIPALVDHSQNPPLRVFESGSIGYLNQVQFCSIWLKNLKPLFLLTLLHAPNV